MLEIVASSILAWFNIFRQSHPTLQPLEFVAWENTAIFTIPDSNTRDRHLREKIIKTYLQKLTSQGINSDLQGIWLQSDWGIPVSNQGKTLLPAASLTKIATTLSALNTWGAKHQFITDIYSTGEINNGIITGDLIVAGSGDPFFVWEEAIALGNSLNQMGIREVQGDLLVTDKFYMNYQQPSQDAGELLKQGLNYQLWESEITQQYQQMPLGTAQPKIAIAGTVKPIMETPSTAQLLLRHQSLLLAEILRQMNIYSNNEMAQMLADLLGGATEVAKVSAEIANFSLGEIQLNNGSGLGEENRISPHAVCQMLIAIDQLLQKHSLSISDLFPTAGKDIVGTVQKRGLPPGTTIKTGTLDNVSALAGVIPTSDRGQVYFSIINYGRQVDYFRQQQDQLLNELVQNLQLVPNNFNLAQRNNLYLGDPRRNSIVKNQLN
jgi:serine-type D-Ala-D-Ala carboxypeptidase/endopeptidase (penicillin-binding protein 4)